MKKADCRKMQKITPTPKIMRLANSKVTGKNYYGKPYKGLFKFYLRAINQNGMVKISLFDAEWLAKGSNESRFDIFINTGEVRYITLEKNIKGKEVKWRSATISYLIYDEYNWYNNPYKNRIWSNADTDTKLRKALGIVQGCSFDVIKHYQQNILDERIAAKEEAECSEWDLDMKPIRPVPKNFTDWIRKHAIKNHYIFYEYKRKITSGFCSCCGKEVKLKGSVKHGKPSMCPRCKRPITYRSIGRIKTLCSDSVDVQLVQPYPAGYVIRIFRCRMYYQNSNFRTPIVNSYEFRRYLYTTKKKMYVWEMYKQKYMRWIRADYSGYWEIDGPIYPRNLKLLPEYDMLQTYFDTKKKIQTLCLSKWSDFTIKGTIYEKVLKAGFFKLFEQLYVNNYYVADYLKTNETELHKALALDKMRMKRLKAMNGGIRELMWLQWEKEADTIWPDEMIRLFSDSGCDKYRFRFIEEHMTYPQIFEYLKKQYERYGYTWDYTISCWRDYMNMAEKLNIPLNLERNYKPKDVRLAHNEVLDMLQGKDIENEAKRIDKRWKKLKKVYPKLKKYEYGDKNYRIIAPEKTEDIVREGMILKHCVHSCDFYFNRISTDESYILFLRKADTPTVPYYTLEVEPGGNVRQKRTTGDRQNKDFEEAKQFINKWQRAIQKKITKKDKELGDKSNKLRLQELAELRKNGNRIWHGVLQGQLLADVLEADFMPVIDGKEELPDKAV